MGQCPCGSCGEAAGQHPDAENADGQGVTEGQKPVATWAKGRCVCKRSEHPRWIHVLPNGDVLVAEANQIPGPKGLFQLRDASDDETCCRAWR